MNGALSLVSALLFSSLVAGCASDPKKLALPEIPALEKLQKNAVEKCAGLGGFGFWEAALNGNVASSNFFNKTYYSEAAFRKCYIDFVK
jgi:hypothetical protein